MAFITKADIVNGTTILADFWTRIIRALDGTDITDIRIKGELQLDKDKLKIDGTAVTTSATDLNGLAGRTAGVVVDNKPIIAGANKTIDELRVEILKAGSLILDVPDLGVPMGKIVAYQNFK